MLIKYEYEVLSYIALKGISKRNGDLIISRKRIEEEPLEDIDYNLQLLESKGLIQLEEDKIIINSDEWVEFFLNRLTSNFVSNNMNVACEKVSEEKDNHKYFEMKFTINGSEKAFKLVIDKNAVNCEKNEDLIFMCSPNSYEDRIYWIELLNNVNLLNIFYSYLASEINCINKEKYRNMDMFSGLDDKYVNLIFESSIKNYFKRNKKEIVNFNPEESKVIEKFINSDDLCYYGVKFEDMTLWVIRNKKKIGFLTIKDKELVYSKDVENELNFLQEKISKKVSEFYKLSMFKEYNVLDNSLKIIGQVSTLFVPTTIIINILGFLNINISTFQGYKYALYVTVVILAIVQILIGYFVYIPSIKISKFNWSIK